MTSGSTGTQPDQPQTPEMRIQEQADLCILEADGGEGIFNPDGTVNMVLIRPCNGRGPYTNIYEADVLARDAHTFKGCASFDNHDSPVARKARAGLPRPVSDLAGVVREAWWDPEFTSTEDGQLGFGKGAVVGKLALTDPMEALVRKVPEAIKGSLNAQATNKRLGQRNGKRGWIVEGFVNDPENTSFDLVTKAGAGGRVRSVLEALYDPASETSSITPDEPSEGDPTMTDVLEALGTDEGKELVNGIVADRISEAVTAGVAAALEEERDSIRESIREEFAAANQQRSLASEARRIIEAAKLPAAAKTNLFADYALTENDDDTVSVGRSLQAVEAVTDDEGTVTKTAKQALKEQLEEDIKRVRQVIAEAAPTVPRAPGGGQPTGASSATFGGENSAWAQQLRKRGLDPSQFGAPKPETQTANGK